MSAHPTPVRALFAEVVLSGYANTQVDFARLLKLSENNISSYMARPNASYRIVPRMDTLSFWAWALSRSTNLSVTMTVTPDHKLFWDIAGWDKDGNPVEFRRVPTSWAQTDARPLSGWHDEFRSALENGQGNGQGHTQGD